MHDRAWKLAALIGLCAVVGFLLFDEPLVVETIWTVTTVSCAAAIPIGLRLHQPSRRRPWVTLGVAIGLLAFSNVLIHPLWVRPAIATIADAIAIPALVLVAVGVFQMANAQVPGGDREGAIDAAIVMIATATALAATVHHPDRLASGISGVEVVLHSVAGPLLMAVIVAGGMRLLFAGTGRLLAGWLLGGAAFSAMAGNIVRAEQIVAGTYQRGTVSELLVLAPYVLIGMAALHPSAATLVEASTWHRRRLTHARLLVLGVALLVPPITMVASSRDVQILTGIATVLVALLVLWRVSRLAVENEASRRELRQQAERQESLADLGRRALDTHDPDRLIAEAVALCIQQLDLERCEVTGLDDQSQPVSSVNDPAMLTQTFGLGDSDLALVVTYKHPPDAEDRAFVESVVTLITVALERQASESQLRWAATHDPLTSLPNRAMVHDHLGALLQQLDQHDELHVVFIDLDDFKQVNDTYGHHIGDQLLIAVAQRLQATVRDGDVVGRIAGDEFVVVCPSTGSDAANDVAQRLTAQLRRPFAIDGHQITIGASAGVAGAMHATADAESLVAQADAAMYSAKAHTTTSS